MADSILSISSSGEEQWDSSKQVKSGNQLTGIKYKIVLNGRKSVRIVFPVYDAGARNPIPKETALMTKTDWENINLVFTDPSIEVHADRTNLPPGVYDFTINGNVAEFTFSLKIESVLTSKIDSARAACNLQYSIVNGRTNWFNIPGGVTIIIATEISTPKLVKFTADPIVIGLNGMTKLSWEVSGADSIQIISDDGDTVPGDLHNKGQSDDIQLQKTTKYTLKAKNKIGDLTVVVNLSTNLVPVDHLFENQKLMGLYTWGEKIYALVFHQNQSTPENVPLPDNVLLWESYEGMNWKKSNVYSTVPAFITSSADPLANVPIDFAGSPGIVFKDKLYLIGGSRYDPNFRSNEVYYFDFIYSETIPPPQIIPPLWKKGDNAGFTPRMGHACIVIKDKNGHDKEIWVLGGYDNGGANNDVWKFDGSIWTCISLDAIPTLPGNRFMHSAIIYNDCVQFFGGFGDDPGVPDQNFNSSYFLNDNKWKAFETPNDTFYNHLYRSCAVAVNNDHPFIFYKSKKEATVRYMNIETVPEATTTLGDPLLKADFKDAGIFNIQAVPFKNVIWVCVLCKASDNKIPLMYFFYV